MYKFFVNPSQITEDEAVIVGADVNHMKNVLRFKAGKEVMVCDGMGNDFICSVHRYTEDEAFLKVLDKADMNSELPVEIVLFQGMPKKDKLEWVIQKSVELGASEVAAVAMKRSVVKVDDKSKEKKLLRWQGIADAAAKQAKRGIQPEVTFHDSLKAAETSLRSCELLLVPYENAEGMKATRETLSDVRNYAKIGIVIGPEGGFEGDEIRYLASLGGHLITLGKRILRTETAGLALMSYLMMNLEDE